MHQFPVLIVGGSLVGLSASLFLSWRGVPNVVVERHRGSALHPRAIGFTERTLEYFKYVGVADQIPEVPRGMRLRRAVVESLTGRWLRETEWTPGGDAPASRQEASPHTGAAIAQDQLEPILRARTVELGSRLLQGAELLSFEQDADGVSGVVRHRDTGQVQIIKASFLIAADGASSRIRETLGIERDGVGYLRTVASVLFRCPQADQYLERGVQQFEIELPDVRAFLASYGDGRWVLMRTDGGPIEAQQRDAFIRTCLGTDLDFEVITTGQWEMAGRIAGRFSQGRVFLAGDAAHQLPPTRGGFGANTGIDDAWNLCWKLAYVLDGRSSMSLLDTYDDERRPIAWLRHQQTFSRPDHARWLKEPTVSQALLGDTAMELGQLHRSAAVVGAGADLAPAAHPDEWAGQPGVRAPHLDLRRGNELLSTLDLMGRNFTLFTEEESWAAAARRASQRTGLHVDVVHVGRDFEDPRRLFRFRFGLEPAGASLVRPDGIVGWRTQRRVADPEQAIVDALGQTAQLRDDGL